MEASQQIGGMMKLEDLADLIYNEVMGEFKDMKNQRHPDINERFAYALICEALENVAENGLWEGSFDQKETIRTVKIQRDEALKKLADIKEHVCANS